MQHRLKSAAGATWTRVVSTELLDELFVSAHDSHAALDVCLGREALATLASDLESSRLRGDFFVYARDTSGDATRGAHLNRENPRLPT